MGASAKGADGAAGPSWGVLVTSVTSRTPLVRLRMILALFEARLPHPAAHPRMPPPRPPWTVFSGPGLKTTWMVWQGDPYQSYLDSR